MIVEQLRNVETQITKRTVHGSCVFCCLFVGNLSVNGIAVGFKRFQSVTFVRH